VARGVLWATWELGPMGVPFIHPCPRGRAAGPELQLMLLLLLELRCRCPQSGKASPPPPPSPARRPRL